MAATKKANAEFLFCLLVKPQSTPALQRSTPPGTMSVGKRRASSRRVVAVLDVLTRVNVTKIGMATDTAAAE